MAGSKKNKLKKVSSFINPTSPDPVDDELVDDLLAQLDARDATVQQESAQVLNEIQINRDLEKQEKPKKDSKTRHKLREMRKAAARLAQQGPEDRTASEKIKKETEEEEKTIRELCDAQGLEIHEISPDGHCLFAAVADQLAHLSILPPKTATYQATRQVAADYIQTHPDDFLPFLISMDGEDGDGNDSGPMSAQELQKYCATIRDTGAWGGEPEIQAMARAFNIPIQVIQWGAPSVVIHSPNPDFGGSLRPTDRAVRVSYHRRMYGLGEHYNSLRPKIVHRSGSLADVFIT